MKPSIIGAVGMVISVLGGTGSPGAGQPSQKGVVLRVVHATVPWRVLPPVRSDGVYVGIALGSDGYIWVADSVHGLERVSADGTRQIVPLGFVRGASHHTFRPAAIAVGADGKFYLTGCVDTPRACGFVAIVTAGKVESVVPTPSGGSTRFTNIARGPDGKVWFTEPAAVAKIDPAGTITEYRYPTGDPANELSGMAAADGKMWFTEYQYSLVDNIDPTTGRITQYPIVGLHLTCKISGMAAAAGDVYFACEGFDLGFIRMKANGTSTFFATNYLWSNGPAELAPGPGGTVWFSGPNLVAVYDPALLQLTTYLVPPNQTSIYGSAVGPGGDMWMLAQDGTVYIVPVGSASPEATGRN